MSTVQITSNTISQTKYSSGASISQTCGGAPASGVKPHNQPSNPLLSSG